MKWCRNDLLLKLHDLRRTQANVSSDKRPSGSGPWGGVAHGLGLVGNANSAASPQT